VVDLLIGVGVGLVLGAILDHLAFRRRLKNSFFQLQLAIAEAERAKKAAREMIAKTEKLGDLMEEYGDGATPGG